MPNHYDQLGPRRSGDAPNTRYPNQTPTFHGGVTVYNDPWANFDYSTLQPEPASGNVSQTVAPLAFNHGRAASDGSRGYTMDGSPYLPIPGEHENVSLGYDEDPTAEGGGGFFNWLGEQLKNIFGGGTEGLTPAQQAARMAAVLGGGYLANRAAGGDSMDQIVRALTRFDPQITQAAEGGARAAARAEQWSEDVEPLRRAAINTAYARQPNWAKRA